MKQTISILMILILALSNFGVTIGSHYCGGDFVESKIILSPHDIGCGMEINPDCESTPILEYKPEDCCKSEFETLESNLQVTFSLLDIWLDSEHLFSKPSYILYNIDCSDDKQILHTSPPSLPLSKNGYQVLHQSFLI